MCVSAESGLETEKEKKNKGFKVFEPSWSEGSGNRKENRVVGALRFESWRWLKVVLHEGEAGEAPVGRDHMVPLGR